MSSQFLTVFDNISNFRDGESLFWNSWSFSSEIPQKTSQKEGSVQNSLKPRHEMRPRKADASRPGFVQCQYGKSSNAGSRGQCRRSFGLPFY